MEKKFIYVDTEEKKQTLIAKGYTLLKSDPSGNIFIFLADGKETFALEGIEYAEGDVLLF